MHDEAWIRTPIDRSILGALESRGLKPNPPADRRTLIRRVSFDFTGLPPSTEELDAFVTDPSPDAYEHLSTVWLAGGGMKGGISHGATDEVGYSAAVDPVHINDLHATILHLIGIDHERLTYTYNGRRFRLTDVAGKVVRSILA